MQLEWASLYPGGNKGGGGITQEVLDSFQIVLIETKFCRISDPLYYDCGFIPPCHVYMYQFSKNQLLKGP